MTKYLTPLWIFLFGQMVAVLLFILLPTIGATADQLAADTAAISGAFWNWDLFSSANFVKFLVFLSVELLTLYATARAFLKVR